MFEIKQKIITNFYINGLTADINYVHIAYVENEILAKEFCEKHTDCTYFKLTSITGITDLEELLITDKSDLELITIPVKKAEIL